MKGSTQFRDTFNCLLPSLLQISAVLLSFSTLSLPSLACSWSHALFRSRYLIIIINIIIITIIIIIIITSGCSPSPPSASRWGHGCGGSRARARCPALTPSPGSRRRSTGPRRCESLQITFYAMLRCTIQQLSVVSVVCVLSGVVAIGV